MKNHTGGSIASATEFQTKCKLFYEEAAYWVGYLFQYWRFLENITPQELLQYDMSEIIYSYDILHTQSITYAIDWVKNKYKKD